MKKLLVWTALLLLPALGFGAASKAKWRLEKSKVTYTVTHPLHVVHGKSLAARGEGLHGSDGAWHFLVAVSVKSFDSGDNNRDLHMQEVTRAGLHPLVKVNVDIGRIADQKAPQKLTADVKIEFAGKTAEYPKVELNILEWRGGQAHLTGTVPLTLKDFEIPPPALLTLAVHNEVPVKLDMWWSDSGKKAEKK